MTKTHLYEDYQTWLFSSNKYGQKAQLIGVWGNYICNYTNFQQVTNYRNVDKKDSWKYDLWATTFVNIAWENNMN